MNEVKNAFFDFSYVNDMCSEWKIKQRDQNAHTHTHIHIETCTHTLIHLASWKNAAAKAASNIPFGNIWEKNFGILTKFSYFMYL